MMRGAVASITLVALAACGQSQSGGDTPEATNTEIAPEEAPLDGGALQERDDPARVLGYLATALGEGKWDEAAKAWRRDQGMTGERLKAMVNGGDKPIVAFGTGEAEGAAGSLYYETDITVIGADGAVLHNGTITLKRVNDVPGAEDWQLVWHVEQIAWND